MGASQSSQPPPSRHNSRHGPDNKHKQKAASVSSPLKPNLPGVDNPAPNRVVTPQPPVVQTMPTPAIAVPIPGAKKSISSASGENSYVDQHKDADLLHRMKDLDVKDMEEEMDEKEVESKFGIAWVASDEFEDDLRKSMPSLWIALI
jgi:hypothetical protein